MTATLLDYAIHSVPSPLTTGAKGAFSIIATNPGDAPVKIKRILLSIPLGPDASSLCVDLQGVNISPPVGWSVTESGGSLVFSPPTSGTVLKGGALVMEVSGFVVNGIPGGLDLILYEEAAVASLVQPPEVTLPLLKVVPGLSIDRFTATPQEIAPNGSAMLQWQGSAGASYVISYEGQKIDHVKGEPGTSLPNAGSYVIEGIDQTTTFTLIATKAGYSDPATAATTVSVVEAKVDTFSVDRVTAVVGEPVTLSWTVTGTSVSLEPGGHVFPTKSGIGQKGKIAVTPATQPATFTLTAHQGDLSDQKQLTVDIQEPSVTMASDAPSIEPLKDIKLTWDVSNVKRLGCRYSVTGKLSGHVYTNVRINVENYSPMPFSFDGFQGIWPGGKVFGGEPVEQSIEVDVLPGLKPISQTRTIPYDGPQDLQLKVTTNVSTVSELDEAIAKVAAEQFDLALPDDAKKTKFYVFLLTGSVEHATAMEVYQTNDALLPWITFSTHRGAQGVFKQPVTVAERPDTGKLPFAITLLFPEALGIDVLNKALPNIAVRAVDTHSGVYWLGLHYEEGHVVLLKNAAD